MDTNQGLPGLYPSSITVPNTEGMSVKEQYLPVGSSRQVVRAELFKRAFDRVTDVIGNSRRERRKIALKMAKDLWRQGERLTRATINSEAFAKEKEG